MAAARRSTSDVVRKRISMRSIRGILTPSQGDDVTRPAWTAERMILDISCPAFVTVDGASPLVLSSEIHVRTVMYLMSPSAIVPNWGRRYRSSYPRSRTRLDGLRSTVVARHCSAQSEKRTV